MGSPSSITSEPCSIVSVVIIGLPSVLESFAMVEDLRGDFVGEDDRLRGSAPGGLIAASILDGDSFKGDEDSSAGVPSFSKGAEVTISGSEGLQILSWESVRCVLSAGGGPVEVSMPCELRDAGGRLNGGERGSRPDDAG